MNWELKEIELGDVVRVNMGAYYHYGICTAENRIVQFGLPVINLNPNDVKVCFTDIKTFLCGKFAEVMVLNKKELKQANSIQERIKKAESALGETGYNILHNNCEHFVNRCVFNTNVSSQVDDVAKMLFNKITPKEIYVAEISKFCNNKKLPKFALAELKQITNEKVKQQKIAAYGLLDYALKHSFNLDDNFKLLRKTKFGKPVCKNYYLSISHTNNLVAVGVSKCPLGIDIEIVKNSKNLEELQKFILSENEPKTSSVEEIIAVWTQKEAYFKFSDEKCFMPKNIDSSAILTKTFKHEFNNEKYYISIAADDVGNVKIYYI